MLLALIVQAIMPALRHAVPGPSSADSAGGHRGGLSRHRPRLHLLGLLRGGDLVRFLPFPVIAGFLAGSAGCWLAVRQRQRRSGSTQATFGRSWSRPTLGCAGCRAWLWGYVLFWRQHVNNHYLNMPVLLSLGAAAFWLVAVGLGIGPRSCVQVGWLLGPFPSGSLLEPLRLAPASIMSPGECWPSSCRSSPRWSSSRS